MSREPNVGWLSDNVACHMLWHSHILMTTWGHLVSSSTPMHAPWSSTLDKSCSVTSSGSTCGLQEWYLRHSPNIFWWVVVMMRKSWVELNEEGWGSVPVVDGGPAASSDRVGCSGSTTVSGGGGAGACGKLSLNCQGRQWLGLWVHGCRSTNRKCESSTLIGWGCSLMDGCFGVWLSCNALLLIEWACTSGGSWAIGKGALVQMNCPCWTYDVSSVSSPHMALSRCFLDFWKLHGWLVNALGCVNDWPHVCNDVCNNDNTIKTILLLMPWWVMTDFKRER